MYRYRYRYTRTPSLNDVDSDNWPLLMDPVGPTQRPRSQLHAIHAYTWKNLLILIKTIN